MWTMCVLVTWYECNARCFSVSAHCNLLARYNCLYKEIASQNAVVYNQALLTPAMFSEFETENSLPMLFLQKFFSEKKIFWRDKI